MHDEVVAHHCGATVRERFVQRYRVCRKLLESDTSSSQLVERRWRIPNSVQSTQCSKGMEEEEEEDDEKEEEKEEEKNNLRVEDYEAGNNKRRASD